MNDAQIKVILMINFWLYTFECYRKNLFVIDVLSLTRFTSFGFAQPKKYDFRNTVLDDKCHKTEILSLQRSLIWQYTRVIQKVVSLTKEVLLNRDSFLLFFYIVPLNINTHGQAMFMHCNPLFFQYFLPVLHTVFPNLCVALPPNIPTSKQCSLVRVEQIKRTITNSAEINCLS